LPKCKVTATIRVCRRKSETQHGKPCGQATPRHEEESKSDVDVTVISGRVRGCRRIRIRDKGVSWKGGNTKDEKKEEGRAPRGGCVASRGGGEAHKKAEEGSLSAQVVDMENLHRNNKRGLFQRVGFDRTGAGVQRVVCGGL